MSFLAHFDTTITEKLVKNIVHLCRMRNVFEKKSLLYAIQTTNKSHEILGVNPCKLADVDPDADSDVDSVGFVCDCTMPHNIE
jgi:hypothetical protein